MKLSGHEINSQLRQKLEVPTGRHLYVILGTYGRLERYERVDFREARSRTGQRLADPVNINQQLLERIPDEELKRMVQTEALLEQGKDEPFIADVLAASSDETLAETLAQCIPADPAHAKLLAKYLKKIVVKVVHLQDFQPSKTKVEKADIETVVGEFRKFLEAPLDDRDGKQSIIGQIR
jgi:hypothetical protein